MSTWITTTGDPGNGGYSSDNYIYTPPPNPWITLPPSPNTVPNDYTVYSNVRPLTDNDISAELFRMYLEGVDIEKEADKYFEKIRTLSWVKNDNLKQLKYSQK